jgi:hypothetical protein
MVLIGLELGITQGIAPIMGAAFLGVELGLGNRKMVI